MYNVYFICVYKYKYYLYKCIQGNFSGIFDCMKHTAKEGPLAFYKGFTPAWIRLTPQTILTWMFLEKLRALFPPSS